MNPPDNAVRYRQSIGMVWFYRVFAALALGLATLCGFALIPGWKPANAVIGVLAVVLFGGGSLYCWGAARRARDVFAVNETGIWRLRPKVEPLFIAWTDAAVRADDTMQRLIVTNLERTRTIWLEYQLEDLATLRDYIRAHIPSASVRGSVRPQVFHRSWINKVILTFFALCMLAMAALFSGHIIPMALACLAGCAFLLFGISQDPLALTIRADRVVINFTGWKRDIPFSDISVVTSGDEFDRGNVWAVVTIVLTHGKPIKLYRFREGSLAMADALKAAIGQTSDGAQSPGSPPPGG